MRQHTLFVWVAVIAILLTLLNLPLSVSRQAKAAVREALAPLHALASGVALRVGEAVGTVRGLGGLVGENRRLAEEVVRLRAEVRDLRGDAEENRALRRQLGFVRETPRRLIPCEVIARDVGGWWQTVRLGRGTRDGVSNGLAVVTADGLAGRTLDCSERTADVLLISDPNCRVSARVARTGACGVVTGQGVKWNGQVVCRMDFINRNLPARPGDEVVTSGLGGVFPEGLLIGYVEQVEQDAAGLYQRAELIPRADVGTMRYAFVLAPAAGLRAPVRLPGEVGSVPTPSPAGVPAGGGGP